MYSTLSNTYGALSNIYSTLSKHNCCDLHGSESVVSTTMVLARSLNSLVLGTALFPRGKLHKKITSPSLICYWIWLLQKAAVVQFEFDSPASSSSLSWDPLTVTLTLGLVCMSNRSYMVIEGPWYEGMTCTGVTSGLFQKLSSGRGGPHFFFQTSSTPRTNMHESEPPNSQDTQVL